MTQAMRDLLLAEAAEIVQSARHLSESDWRVFTREVGKQLSQRKPHPSEFWIVESMGDSLDYWGPWETEQEARESDLYKRHLEPTIIEIPADGSPRSIAAASRRRAVRMGEAS